MSASASLIDELADLLDGIGGGTSGAAVPPPSAGAVSTPVSLSAVAPVDRRAFRENLADEALCAVRDIVQVIRRTFAENGADFDDACKALPLLHRILEHTDRMEIANKQPGNLHPLNFQIVLDGSPQVAPPRRAAVISAPYTIDMEPTE